MILFSLRGKESIMWLSVWHWSINQTEMCDKNPEPLYIMPSLEQFNTTHSEDKLPFRLLNMCRLLDKKNLLSSNRVCLQYLKRKCVIAYTITVAHHNNNRQIPQLYSHNALCVWESVNAYWAVLIELDGKFGTVPLNICWLSALDRYV